MVSNIKKYNKNKISHSSADRIYFAISGILITILLLVICYPVVLVISASFSSGAAVASGKVVLLPVDVSLEGYKAVFRKPDIWRAYYNTILYTVLGTSLNVTMAMITAYPLSRSDLKGRNLIMFVFTFTMFFSGGLIPFYILMTRLDLLNRIWVMILPGALSVYNMIITRTFIQSSIPDELLQAASIDGCSDARYFFSIVLPLSKTVMAVVALFSAVTHWNSYFNAMMFLNDRNLFPLQIILREILIMNQIDFSMVLDPELEMIMANLASVLKFSLIVVATIPILCVYPFAQRYFIKGVMIGSIKG